MNGGDARVWENLSLYESIDLLKSQHQRTHNRSLSTTKAKRIASYFAQGHEYFDSAAGAGELVRPLIIFYGAMSLSRGAILFLNTRKEELRGGHGLQERQWQDLTTQPRSLPDFQLTVLSTGTFPDLSGVTKNAEMNRIRADGPPGVITALYQGTNPIGPGTQITIKDVLGQIPDLAEIFESTFNEFSRCLRGDALAHNPFDENEDGSAWIAVYETRRGVPEPSWVSQELGSPHIAMRPIEEQYYFGETATVRAVRNFWFGFPYARAYEREPHLDTALGLPVTVSRRTGEVFVKLPTSGGIELSNLAALYLISFATGSLVRYHPAYWMAVTSRATGDSFAPILSAAASAVEELFPKLVLEQLS